MSLLVSEQPLCIFWFLFYHSFLFYFLFRNLELRLEVDMVSFLSECFILILTGAHWGLWPVPAAQTCYIEVWLISIVTFILCDWASGGPFNIHHCMYDLRRISSAYPCKHNVCFAPVWSGRAGSVAFQHSSTFFMLTFGTMITGVSIWAMKLLKYKYVYLFCLFSHNQSVWLFQVGQSHHVILNSWAVMHA